MGIILTFSLFALPLPFLSLSKYLEHESKSLSNWGRSLSGQMLVRLVDFFLTPLDANCCNDGLCVVIGAEDGCWITLLGLIAVHFNTTIPVKITIKFCLALKMCKDILQRDR